MVSVGQYEAGAQLLQLAGGKGFDGGLGANRRKNRRVQSAMRRVKDAGTRCTIGCQHLKLEHLGTIIPAGSKQICDRRSGDLSELELRWGRNLSPFAATVRG